MSEKIYLGSILGTSNEDDFNNFDITEIQELIAKLQNEDPIDLAHAELYQQRALRGADILAEFLGKIIKTIGYLEARVNSVTNKISLEYQAVGGKTTTDMKIWAGKSSPEVEELGIKLARAKATKIVLEKKYDILIRIHHQHKDLAQGFRKTILGYSVNQTE